MLVDSNLLPHIGYALQIISSLVLKRQSQRQAVHISCDEYKKHENKMGAYMDYVSTGQN